MRTARAALCIVLVGVAGAALGPAASAAAVNRGNGAPPPGFSPSRVIVEWAGGSSAAQRRSARSKAGVEYAEDLGSRRFQLVEAKPRQSPGRAVRELEAEPGVLHAERDGYYHLDSLPDDPLFGRQWALRNTGLGVDFFSGAVAGDDIGVLGAWERTVGTPGTVVADIDSGYRFEHPDLANVVWTNPGEVPENGIDDDGDGIVDDVHGADFVGLDATAPVTDGDPSEDDPFTRGHGVHTAGIVGAQGNNGTGVAGVAQGVSIMPLRACSRHGSDEEESCPFSAVIEAVNYAGVHGARVANLSLGGDHESEALADAIAANPQTLFAIAAGNEGADDDVAPEYPCVYDPLAEGRSAIDNVICVAATDQADSLAGFSNWGAATVDLGAPGTQILSTAPYAYIVHDDFEADDFASKWTDSGADGGFARTNEPPLTSYGIADSPGAAPAPGSTRASTSVPVTVTPGYESCDLEYTRWVSGGSLWIELLIDGEAEFGFGEGDVAGRRVRHLLGELSEGGEVALRFSYKAGSSPGPGDGAWVDDVAIHCIAKPGEADGYRFAEGTSMAAPQVTGAAGLLFSRMPGASVTEVRRALLGSVDSVPSLAGKTSSGGRLDVSAAMDFLESPPAEGGEEETEAGDEEPGEEGTGSGGGETEPGGGETEPSGPGGGEGGAGASATAAPSKEAGNPAPASSPSGSLHAPRPRLCVVPKLAGKTLKRAKRALHRAGCRLGRVRPRRQRGHGRRRRLVVRSTAPRAGRRPPRGKVDVRLGPKPRTAHRGRHRRRSSRRLDT